MSKPQSFHFEDKAGLQNFVSLLSDCVDSFGSVSVDVVAGKKRKSSQPMKGTWRMWMKETAKWMSDNGATMPLYYRPNGEPYGKRPFNEQDAHEAFMRTWGGVNANGDRQHQEAAEKGLMLHIMDRHLMWAIEKGISLTIPADGEYMKLKSEQG